MRQIKKLKMPKLKVLKQNRRLQQLTAALTIVIVVAIGTYLLSGARAQSPYVAIGADSGTLGGSATTQSNTSATDGKYVQFGSASSSSGSFEPLVGEITSPIGGNSYWPSPAQYQSWLGHKVDIIGWYDQQVSGSWYDIEGNDTDVSTLASVANTVGAKVELGAAMLPTDGTYCQDPYSSTSCYDTDLTALADGAAGDFNSNFQELAQNLVNDGLSNAIIRLGWESNGDWYPWSSYISPTDFDAYWVQIVDSMRSVSGEHFLFDWNGAAGNLGTTSTPATDAYPGDNYVDFIGEDIYDNSSWSNNSVALQSISSFAAQHNKYVILGEWGVGALTGGCGGSNDDPTFIQNMYNYIYNLNNRVAAAMYFNECDSALYSVNPGTAPGYAGGNTLPNSAALYQSLFSKAPAGVFPSSP
jgi:hypothetical protein